MGSVVEAFKERILFRSIVKGRILLCLEAETKGFMHFEWNLRIIGWSFIFSLAGHAMAGVEG